MNLDGARPQPLSVAADADYAALPTDVLHDILLRLPAAEVRRLRLVCRPWRALTHDPLFIKAHSSRHPPNAAVLSYSPDEVHVVDLHGGVVRRIPIGWRPGERLTTHGDLACVSHGWGLAYVLDLATGAVVADIDAEHRRQVNAVKPTCLLGHVPSTGEYKVLRLQDVCRHYGRSSPQTFELITLGGGGRSRLRWRKGPRPPVMVSCSKPSSWSMAVVAGFAYFLTSMEEVDEPPDSVAVFDMAAEEWRPTTIQGPLMKKKLIAAMSPAVCCRRELQLAGLGESLVMVYCNLEHWSTELWFLLDMEESVWIRQYTLRGTPFGNEMYSLRYHYPLLVLDDGRILVWVYGTGALRAYDPRTSVWSNLATVEGHVGMHHGSLLL